MYILNDTYRSSIGKSCCVSNCNIRQAVSKVSLAAHSFKLLAWTNRAKILQIWISCFQPKVLEWTGQTLLHVRCHLKAMQRHPQNKLMQRYTAKGKRLTTIILSASGIKGSQYLRVRVICICTSQRSDVQTSISVGTLSRLIYKYCNQLSAKLGLDPHGWLREKAVSDGRMRHCRNIIVAVATIISIAIGLSM